MIAAVQRQPKRPRFAGVRQIARYNWPQYVVALGVVVAASAWLFWGKGDFGWLRVSLCSAVLVCGWWCFASLAASYWVYDRSELYRWTWIPPALSASPVRWLNLHAGLDESSAALRRLFPEGTGQVADFYDGMEMSEPSIHRARIEQAGRASEPVDYRQLPYPDRAFDAVFLFFAAHELRRASSREVFFGELSRVLAPGGAVVLVEHLRDLANFAAFGPGFLHFLSGLEWRRLAGLAGLRVWKEERMTPFVRVLFLRKP